jgi:hypothetical protein
MVMGSESEEVEGGEGKLQDAARLAVPLGLAAASAARVIAMNAEEIIFLAVVLNLRRARRKAMLLRMLDALVIAYKACEMSELHAK